MEKLQRDGLDLDNCRGQGYDGGANMAGKENGVNAHISRLNKYAGADLILVLLTVQIELFITPCLCLLT